jgi:predicted aldo/keto reductase-like oxidoreductase
LFEQRENSSISARHIPASTPGNQKAKGRAPELAKSELKAIPRCDVHFSPGAIFALHFPRKALTLSTFWEEHSMEHPTRSFFEPDPEVLTRRKFLSDMLTTSLLAGVASAELWAAGDENGIPYRKLGRSGERVSVIGLGGWHLGIQSDEQESVRIIRTALDSGINFLDNCWDYNNGGSEIRMGKALRDGYRQKAFLMTKIDGQTRKAAAAQLDESLHRLQTDRIDLLQFHEVIRMTDPERIFAPGGGMEAVLEAKKAGKVRYIGFTGHKNPAMHLHMLETAAAHQFHFDAVQMPLNAMDAHFESFGQKVLPVLVKNEIGVLGMKPMGAGLLLRSKTVSPVECLHYAMNLPTSVVITGCESLANLQQALDAARSFKPLSAAESAALLARTEQAARSGEFELYKNTHNFDGTFQNPQWLG